jgi:ankyrin repeat protein
VGRHKIDTARSAAISSSKEESMACSHVDTCELFAQFALNPALRVWQAHYCDKDHSRCARYQLARSRQPVPLNLLPNGSKVDAPRSEADYGATAIFNAILKRRAPMVLSFLNTGTDVNVRDGRGMTPLMAAAAIGDVDIIRLLLSKRADRTLTSNDGETAYEIARRGGFGEAAELIGSARGARPVHRNPKVEKPNLFARLLGR